jgi:hypothetical protein
MLAILLESTETRCMFLWMRMNREGSGREASAFELKGSSSLTRPRGEEGSRSPCG